MSEVEAQVERVKFKLSALKIFLWIVGINLLLYHGFLAFFTWWPLEYWIDYRQVTPFKDTFKVKIVKAFIERIGIYPLGTSVELNTKEVAQVIRQNDRMPASPVVRVVYDPQGDKIEKVRYIDLSKGTKIYITRGV